MELIDDTKADDYLGKTVLLGVTYLDHEEKFLEQKQWVGTIVGFSSQEGIRIELRGSDERCVLPPDERGIQKADPGTYRLRSTGEEIVDPDYLATWTCVKGESQNSSGRPPDFSQG